MHRWIGSRGRTIRCPLRQDLASALTRSTLAGIGPWVTCAASSSAPTPAALLLIPKRCCAAIQSPSSTGHVPVARAHEQPPALLVDVMVTPATGSGERVPPKRWWLPLSVPPRLPLGPAETTNQGKGCRPEVDRSPDSSRGSDHGRPYGSAIDARPPATRATPGRFKPAFASTCLRDQAVGRVELHHDAPHRKGRSDIPPPCDRLHPDARRQRPETPPRAIHTQTGALSR